MGKIHNAKKEALVSIQFDRNKNDVLTCCLTTNEGSLLLEKSKLEDLQSMHNFAVNIFHKNDQLESKDLIALYQFCKSFVEEFERSLDPRGGFSCVSEGSDFPSRN